MTFEDRHMVLCGQLYFNYKEIEKIAQDIEYCNSYSDSYKKAVNDFNDTLADIFRLKNVWAEARDDETKIKSQT